MNKICLLAIVLSMGVSGVKSQETYENTKLVDNDLNGTARYVGMGGALDALGADISVIGSNPAGIGIFNRSRADISFGIVSQQGATSFANANPTNTSFDQAGFVYSMKNSYGPKMNLAVNYRKSMNFNYILSAAGALNHASQNTLSFIKAIGGNDDNGTTIFNIESTDNGLMGRAPYTSQLDNLYYNNFTIDKESLPGYNFASDYLMNRANKGYIGVYDINLSGSSDNNQFFYGITVGIHDVHYKGISAYTENLINSSNNAIGSVTVNDERRITGIGTDFKLGIIFLPIKYSPFRIGMSISSPTLYSLTSTNATSLVNTTNIEGYHKGWSSSESYSFKVNTPWKFGLSMGHTVGNYLALGASYEYADYGSIKSRVNTGGGYDWYYGTYYETSANDEVMNSHTSATLKGVSTLKLGAEYKPLPNLALRIGYNYLTPMYNEKGYKDGSIDSYGSNYSSATDYVNWKATNRFTLGAGFTIDRFNIDLAYQYAGQEGMFYPFMDSYGDFNYLNTQTNQVEVEKIDNYANPVKVNNKRHQVLLTLGYAF